jgi:hypothetical protein
VLLCCLGTVLLALRGPHRQRARRLLAVLLLWLLLGLGLGAYLWSPAFRYLTQSFLAPVAIHQVHGSTAALPLPSGAVLAFRSSEESATYWVRGTEGPILAFYERLVGRP